MTILSRRHLTIFNRWDHPWAFRACSSRRIEDRPGANRHTRPLWAELVFARPRKFSRSRQVIYLARGALDCRYIAAATGHDQTMCVGEQQKKLLWPREAQG